MNNSVAGLVCLVFIQFLSFICAVYLLIQCIKTKNILRNISNHLIICLLIVSTWMVGIDLLSTEFYYWYGSVPIQTPEACRFYNVSFFSISSLNRMFMAFMSIERHFLVFRPQLYRIRRSRYLLHYFPIIIIIFWSFIYSLVTDVFLTCPLIHFRYTRYLCGYTCSILVSNLAMFYVWFQVFMPTAITVIASILLPIRFLINKRKLQRLQWRRARRMIVQMSTIASTYIFCWLPYAIILQLVTLNRIPLDNNYYYISNYLTFDAYIPSLLTPFICFHTISGKIKFDILQRIIRYYFPRRQPTINPQNTLTSQNRNPIKFFTQKN